MVEMNCGDCVRYAPLFSTILPLSQPLYLFYYL